MLPVFYGSSVQKILDYASWGFIGLLALPTVLIIATWSSVPGDFGYGVKRAFEGALLVMARPSYDAEASLNAQYTKRRMEEAKALLANNQSSAGLTHLSAQITATKKMIERAPTQEKKREAAKQYIKTLQGVSNELKTQQTKTRVTAAKPVTRRRLTASSTSGEQLQANLQLQLEQVQALQQQLQQQVSQQPQAQQLLAQLAQQAQQLKQLQQQVESAGNQEVGSNQIQQIVEQLNASQEQTQTIVSEITTPENEQEPQEQEVLEISLTNTEEQIQETIEQLEVIAQAENASGQNIDSLLDQLNNGNGNGNGNNNNQNEEDEYNPNQIINNINNSGNSNNGNNNDED